MALIKEDGTGKSDATAYADLTDFPAQLANWLPAHQGNAKIDNLNNDQIEMALQMATEIIDATCPFEGERSTLTQALRFPRSGVLKPDSDDVFALDEIPPGLVRATVYQAKALLMKDRVALLELQEQTSASHGGRSSSRQGKGHVFRNPLAPEALIHLQPLCKPMHLDDFGR